MGFLQFARLSGRSNVVVFDTEGATSIVGPGPVKSRFLDILLRDENVNVWSIGDRTASAQEVRTRKCRFKGMGSDIVLVDTPSFTTRGGLDGGETMEKWIKSKYDRPFAAVWRMTQLPSCVSSLKVALLVPSTSFRLYSKKKWMSNESIEASMTQLRREVDDVGASIMGEPFDGEPRMALRAVTYVSQKAEWESLSGMIEVQRARSNDEPAGRHHETFAKLADLLLQRYRSQYWHLYAETEKELELDEIITLRRRALYCTPTEHPNYSSAAVSLADVLSERFEKEGERGDLDEMIPIRRAALEMSTRGHGEHLESLVNLVNCLDQRFRLDKTMEDMTEIITLRRTLLELTPSGHPRRFAHLCDLANILDQRFKKAHSEADIEEIIILRRDALKCASPALSDQCMSLVSLASCLRDKARKSGGGKELDEAITHARTALELCPPEFYALSRDCLASCVELKIQKTRARVGGRSATSSSNIKEEIWKVVDETVKTIPLWLLNTRTGKLCNRVAQLSNFESSRDYKQLLESASKCNGQQLGALIRKVVLAFFQFAILSHRWGNDEPSLRDIKDRNVYELEGDGGRLKLQNFCLLALKQDYVWAWSDTCCIDKESSAELQEAIGSMFSWYRNSALAIVHLSDVSNETLFTDSVWFKRGWTLQELLAPRAILFYTQDWLPYMNCESSNHKMDSTVLKDLQKASGIGERHLGKFEPGMDGARLRLQWAAARRTTRPEDTAYSLFGVFGLHLPVLYGESAGNAIGRLLMEIISQSGDVSVLDWVGEASSFHSCLPANLNPYQNMPCTHSTSNHPFRREGVDSGSARKLWSDLAELPFARFINHTLALPSMVHRVTVVKAGGMSSSQCQVYEVHASGLLPLQLALSIKLCEGSGADLPYVLVRPWHAKLLDAPAGDSMHAPWKLLEQLAQPFNALLLVKSHGRQYKRIAADRMITCQAQDPSSIVNCEIQTLDIM
ncbi:hypothetical protein BKA83DRAFT_4129402 [Pisolithus microcarpus]|nr:hypothetical protein BKA83DRAFT_4129402 [Pisolithus microcarpus]